MYTHILNRLRSYDRLGQQATPNSNNSNAAAYTAQMQQDLNTLIQLIPEATSGINVFKKAINELTMEQNSLSMGLGKVIGIHSAFNTEIVKLTKNITFLEEHNKELNKIFSVGSETAQGYAETIRNIGQVIGFSDKTLFKFAGGLNDLTNGMLMSSKANSEYQKSLFAFQAYAQEALGVTDEAATGFESYAALIGKSGAETALQLNSLSKALGDELGIDALTAQRDIIQEIGSLSDEVRMNYSKIPGSLEVAVLKAKALGFSMEQLDQVGESLMNIEQSIGAELEYQLLSGKRLLTQQGKSFTNEFRLAKLTGNAEKETELMSDILEQQGDTLRGNYMARKKFAEMAGISDKELSAVLAKDKIAKELGVSELRKLSGDALKTKVDELKKQYAKQGPKGEDQIKQLNKLMESQDTRTTHEKVVEDNLVTIARTIGSISGAATRKQDGTLDKTGRKIDVGTISADLRKNIQGTVTEIKTAFDGGADAIGRFSLRSEASFNLLTKPMTEVATNFSKLAEPIKTLTNSLKFIEVKLPTGDVTEQTKDALIIPDRGPILRPAKNDVIAAFRPNDVIHNTVNDMVKPSSNPGNMSAMVAMLDKTIKSMQSQNSNVNVTMDTVALAKDIAAAMQSVKVEAKIRTDDMYSSNRMNNRKNII